MNLPGMTRWRTLACAVLLAGAPWTVTLAQPPQYKNEAELMGAAMASPEGVGEVLDRLVQKCGLYGEATKTRGNAALRAWQARHRAYLAEGRRVRAELQASYSDARSREQFDALVRTQLPMLVERQFVVYARSIDDQPTAAAKADLCDGYFSAVDDRQFDLTVNDPALAAFFDRRMAGRDAAGDSASAPLAPAPGSGAPAQ
ncbi:hypothetical protein HUS70_12280 [Pandoraea nosoerga]|nr:hypothetical protein [Pandoraea nosoerga]MBN4666236.1 hypothetical protein [Pandoraea nosoerga]MBN4745403.1 hypothetical protein [Pandoraea nosoerga]